MPGAYCVDILKNQYVFMIRLCARMCVGRLAFLHSSPGVHIAVSFSEREGFHKIRGEKFERGEGLIMSRDFGNFKKKLCQCTSDTPKMLWGLALRATFQCSHSWWRVFRKNKLDK